MTGLNRSNLAIGIDVGGTSLKTSIVDNAGYIYEQHQVPTPTSVDALTDALALVVKRAQRQYPIAGVGLAVAGFLDDKCEVVRFAPHLPWRDAPVVKDMERVFQLPVILEHDANAAAWGEWRYGAAVGGKNVVMVAIGTGIGAALLINGQLYRGSFGTAPELGHIQVVRNGRSCACGKRGCWERYCSGTALVETSLELMVANPEIPTVLTNEVGNEARQLTGRRVMQAALAGDEIAVMALDEFSDWLGFGLSMVADVFDPDLVVIAGGVGSAGAQFLSQARQRYTESITGRGYRPVARIRQAELGANAGQVGAAALVLERIAEEERKQGLSG